MTNAGYVSIADVDNYFVEDVEVAEYVVLTSFFEIVRLYKQLRHQVLVSQREI